MNNDLKQDIYQEPELEIVTFGQVDVLSTSKPEGENQLPPG